MSENATFADIGKAVDRATKIAVMSHDRPDGDAIGSVLAMAELLRGHGKDVVALNNDPVPISLKFLPLTDQIQAPASEPIEVDLVISLDAAGKDRISESVWNSVTGYDCVVNIDHHVSNTRYADLNYVDSLSPATGQIVFELAEHQGWSLNRAICDNLYAAISTDTGSFRYPNTTSKTYRIGAALIDGGADVGALNQSLYESYPQRRIELLRELLKEMEFFCDGRCAIMKMTREMINRLKIQPADTEGLIDVIRAIDSVVVAVFFEEMPNGKIRVSSRSKDERANVGDICAGFGGGGHKLAAGTRMTAPIESAIERFIAAVDEKIRAI